MESTIKIQAVNAKNQKAVNKAVKFLIAYNSLNNLRDKADNEGNEKEYRKLDRKCEIAFDKYQECIWDLPKREITKIEKSPLY
jgi:hypothetical protein